MRTKWQTWPVGRLIGAVGHHTYFLTDNAARQRVCTMARTIDDKGLGAFLHSEYPPGTDKGWIFNEMRGHLYVTDGNAHLVALCLARPGLTLGQLAENGGARLIRFWQEGWEEGSGQQQAYDTYIPFGIDTRALANCRVGLDHFKQPPQQIKIIPSDVPYDDAAFTPEDRGRPLQETARALSRLAAKAGPTQA